MATAYEHYREAERLLAEGIKNGWDNGPGCGADEVLAAAKVHATLAAAAVQGADMPAAVVDRLRLAAAVGLATTGRWEDQPSPAPTDDGGPE